MSFSIDSMTRIAHLARLALTDNTSSRSAEDLQQDLTQIVAMVDQIQAINTDGIAPMSHPLKTSLYLRQDLVTEQNQWTTLKALAPKVEAELFLVPKVMD